MSARAIYRNLSPKHKSKKLTTIIMFICCYHIHPFYLFRCRWFPMPFHSLSIWVKMFQNSKSASEYWLSSDLVLTLPWDFSRKRFKRFCPSLKAIIYNPCTHLFQNPDDWMSHSVTFISSQIKISNINNLPNSSLLLLNSQFIGHSLQPLATSCLLGSHGQSSRQISCVKQL